MKSIKRTFRCRDIDYYDDNDDGHRDDDDGDGCDDNDHDGDGCDDNDYDNDDDGQLCGEAADEALPRHHHRVLCVILGEHLLSPSDLLPQWSILSCRL